MSKIVGIYKIVSPSGKVYIGQSWDIHFRWRDHKYDRRIKSKLSASLKKYGKLNHSFQIIHGLPCDIDQATLDRYEQLYMDLYRDCGIILLNIREGGSVGKLSIETKAKIKAKRKLQIITPEHRKKISDANRGKCHNKGQKPWNKGIKTGIIPINKGVIGVFKHSNEHKKNMSDRMLGKKPNNYGKPRSLSASLSTAMKNKGRKYGPEFCEKARQRNKSNPNMGGRKNKGKIRSDMHRFNLGQSLRRNGKCRGVNHNLVKLSEAQVLEIRNKFVPRKYSSRKLATEYGLSKTNILDIVNRRIWVHI